jgi:poly(A) polymerase
MKNIINRFIFRSQNNDYLNLNIKKIKSETEINKIFSAIDSFSKNSEIRFVGGCVRKILNKEKIDDIDLAVNLNPSDVCDALSKKNIKFYKSGIEHGTITAIINNNKFEITSLRKDIDTDGRHATVEFSDNWKEDASRRDFTFNSIYADFKGNLFDPFAGKKDLEIGRVVFIGDAEKRIKEDYLRILRYIRFFLNYSKQKHEPHIVKIIKRNLNGFSKISSERLLNEFQKLVKSKKFLKLMQDKSCLEFIDLIFPQLKSIKIFKNLNSFAMENIAKVDFIFLLSLMTIDGTDNVDYFIYKFNLSKKDQKRLKFLNNFYINKITKQTFYEKNLNKILYFHGKEALMDVIYFTIFKSKKVDTKLTDLIKIYKDKEVPLMPLRAITLMTKYNIQEGKNLGVKLKAIEEFWVDNNFTISEKEVEKIINN